MSHRHTGGHRVQCTEDFMKVDVVLPDFSHDPIETPTQVYLEGMKGYPNTRCEPYVTGNVAQFNLPLQDFFECGVTRVVNQLTVYIYFFNSFHGNKCTNIFEMCRAKKCFITKSSWRPTTTRSMLA